MPVPRSIIITLLCLWLSAPASAAVLRLLFVDPPGSSFDVAAQSFKHEVERRSHGALQVEVHAAGAWQGRHLDELQILQRIRKGEAAMGLLTTAPLGNVSPSLEALDMPFLFSDYPQVDAVLDGPMGQRLLGGLTVAGLHGLAFMDCGFRIFTSSRPLRGLTDLRNLRVRVMQNSVYYSFVKLIGAIPVPAPVDKVYDMARRGYVDAADRSYPTFWEFRQYEVQKYILESNHAYAAKAMVCNLAVWQKLAPPLRSIVTEAATRARDLQRLRFRRDVARARAECRRTGVTVHVLSEADRQHMRDLCRPIYAELERRVGRDLLSQLVQAARAAETRQSN